VFRFEKAGCGVVLDGVGAVGAVHVSAGTGKRFDFGTVFYISFQIDRIGPNQG
jgi:hypothetical protein